MSDVPPSRRAINDKVCFFDLPVELVDKIFAHLSRRALGRQDGAPGELFGTRLYFLTWSRIARVSRCLLPTARRALYGKGSPNATKQDREGRDSFPRHRSAVLGHLPQIGPYIHEFRHPLRFRNESGRSLAPRLSFLTNATMIDLGILPVDAYDVGVAAASLPLLDRLDFTIPPKRIREGDEPFHPKQVAAVQSLFSGLQSGLESFWPGCLSEIGISASHSTPRRSDLCVRDRPGYSDDETKRSVVEVYTLQRGDEACGEPEDLVIIGNLRANHHKLWRNRGLRQLLPAIIQDLPRLRYLCIEDDGFCQDDYSRTAFAAFLHGNRLNTFELLTYDTSVDLPPSFYGLFPHAVNLSFHSESSLTLGKLVLLANTSPGIRELTLSGHDRNASAAVPASPEARERFEQEVLDVLGRMQRLEKVYMYDWPYSRSHDHDQERRRIWRQKAASHGIPLAG